MNTIELADQRFIVERFALPREEQVTALERRLATSFPDDYRKFVLNFNGGIFSEPAILAEEELARGDGLTCLHGIGSECDETELGDPGCRALFADNDSPSFVPIGHRALGGLPDLGHSGRRTGLNLSQASLWRLVSRCRQNREVFRIASRSEECVRRNV